MASARAFSTDFNEHVGLVHTFAKKGWARMIAAQVSVEYEDVFQEMSLTYTKAARTYDPSKGFSFTSYVGRAIWNEFNRYANKYIDEQSELGLLSVQDISTEDGGDFYEVIDSGVATPEESLSRKQEMLNNLRQLSPTAKFLAAQLLSPSPELEQAINERNRIVTETGKGLKVRNPSPSFIADFYNISRFRSTAAIRELKSTYGV